ncbi:NfeD family protein [Psychromicrobium lacuslunae]|uniref:Integral membrane protein n=1 Tax=Psychromicrobium lacuslunae TaxID=1618207 RepID=A0A0D4BX93_9MICC|nr:NfeD family protein [Psychromicrobium lacuslunae]AJT40944.1 integral membrane protein [Psychromicrobium lacuslunae]
MFEWLFENGWALWLLVFLILAGIEMLTLDLFFILMSVGAFAAMISYFLGAEFWLQIVIFCVVALAMILFVRPVALRHLRLGPKDLRTNVDRLIGHAAVVVEPVNAESGLVKIGGDTWSARFRGGQTLAAGSNVVVTEIDGATAIVTAETAAPNHGYPAASTGL